MTPIHLGDVVGDYRVIGIAGSGGMGDVYKIEHVITRRIEAMKILPAGSINDPDQVHRFEREIQVQARLHHPNIAALYNAVRDGDSIALVMEFVEGDSLQRMLEAGPLPVETAVNLASQVLCALAYAHEAGVIHRDVAPANIIVTPVHVAKLTDFGLARGATDLRLSTSGAPLGSPWYMSPEQVKGLGPLDARTDIYAMGAVLHEMLTGRKLFEAEGAFAVMRAHVEAEPAPPSSRNPKVPQVLDDIVRKAVAKDSAMRFQSADEFRLALQATVTDASPVAVSYSPEKTVHATLPNVGSRTRRLPSPRAAMLMASVPAVLMAGLLTGRFFSPSRPPVTENKPRAVTLSPHDAVQPAPAQAAPVEPETPRVDPPTLEAPVAVEKPAAVARSRLQSPAKTLRQDNKPVVSHAIRVTGGEVQPAAAVPLPVAAPWRPAETSESLPPKTDSVETPEVVQPAAAVTADDGATPSQDGVPAKPQNAGNRFVRALGKVNPFRRGTKKDGGEAAKTPLKKD